MMRFLLYVLAACALVGFGAGAALLAAPDKLTLVLGADGESRREAVPPPAPDRTDEILDDVGRLRQALAAFAQALDDAAEERGALHSDLSAERREAARARAGLASSLTAGLEQLGLRGSETRASIDALTLTLADRPGTEAAPGGSAEHTTVEEAPAQDVPPVTAEPEPESAPPAAAPKRKSLAALLAARPKTDVRDRLATWRLVSGHCRVGFDGTSTIHNFTARTEAVEGRFHLNFRNPGSGATGRLRLRVASIDSDNDDRDEEIRSHLAAEEDEAPEISCEVLSVIAPKGQTGDLRRATARVRFRIHGREHEVEAPLTLEFTARRLLHVKGETTLKMSDYDIFPKAKMGFISVDDEVTVWWDLYAEVDRASQG